MKIQRTAFAAIAALLCSLLAAGADLQGDAARGKRLFTSLKCHTCHIVAGEGGSTAPDLGRRNDPGYTPGAMASAMWNHVSAMWLAMDRVGIRRPGITAQQAADLYAWFAGEQRSDPPGDARKGLAVYESRFCARCHDDSYSGAPSLSSWSGRADAWTMISGLWRHGGGMLSRMKSRNTEWQSLTPEDMRNLLAYLNGRK